MEEKITIIEGPPPTFEVVNQEWVGSLNESRNMADIAMTRLRTFNGPALVERCHRAWRSQQSICLEFRGTDGLEEAVPIVAARSIEVADGQMLLLWVRLDGEHSQLQPGHENDLGDESDDDFENPDL